MLYSLNNLIPVVLCQLEGGSTDRDEDREAAPEALLAAVCDGEAYEMVFSASLSASSAESLNLFSLSTGFH